MSEYNHIDKKEYLIAEGKYYRIWNNGIVESYFQKKWHERNPNETWEYRLKFLKLWENAEINKGYDFGWMNLDLIECINPPVIFLGFRKECPECKQSNLIWEGKIQLCKGCDYIHAIEYDDS